MLLLNWALHFEKKNIFNVLSLSTVLQDTLGELFFSICWRTQIYWTSIWKFICENQNYIKVNGESYSSELHLYILPRIWWKSMHQTMEKQAAKRSLLQTTCKLKQCQKFFLIWAIYMQMKLCKKKNKYWFHKGDSQKIPDIL